MAITSIVFACFLAGAAPVSSKGGIVASAHPEASAAGATVLRSGGNALDALIATAYALGVVEPFSAGVGGGGFLLYFDAAAGKTYALDYREVAPQGATRDMFLVDGKVDPNRSIDGPLSVAVPGMVVGLAEAQTKLGKKKLSEVLGPAISLASGGFRVYPRLAQSLEYRRDVLARHASTAAVFLKKDGTPYRVGDLLVQRDHAKMLRSLQQNGPAIWKSGWVAKAIAREMKKLGGVLTQKDLETYAPRWREPLTGQYRGRTLVFMPPPSSGGIAILQTLGMLEIDRKVRGRSDRPDDVDDLFVLLESMKRAYADRATHLGDPAFTKIPMEELLSPDYLLARYKSIDLKRATPSSEVSAGKVAAEPEHTTHITVIDAAGNVAVATQTINYSFGSGIVVSGTGVLLNDEMDDFAAAPGVPNAYGLVGGDANSVAPGKVPLSSMTPTIVLENGQVRLAMGAPGGSTIITTVLLGIIRSVDQGMGLQQALQGGRYRHQWLPDKLLMETDALPKHVVEELTKRGFVPAVSDYWGNATGIEVRADGTRLGVTDWRGDGAAVAE